MNTYISIQALTVFSSLLLSFIFNNSSKAQTIATLESKPQCFTKRLQEYGTNSGNAFVYAACEHSLVEFKSRVKEYGTNSGDTYFYAASNNELCR